MQRPSEAVLPEKAVSVAGKPLPPVDELDAKRGGSILLFYQYKEPPWTKREHKQVLKDFLQLANKFDVLGRGRVAPEGVNCTLSCESPQKLRDFCNALRSYRAPTFHETDFKITDAIPHAQLFQSLSVRKTQELVAYGLAGTDKAPSLEKFAGDHLDATEYHKAMHDPNTVLIDVRNAYESAIGSFAPPEGGATLIDPKLRNSIEFPKWLADERTQQKIHNKNVLMFCTGGIRCERATALLNQMTSVKKAKVEADSSGGTNKTTTVHQPKSVAELQGGIERYLQTYPEGGYWQGKNYLFDRRREQTAREVTKHEADETITQARRDRCLCVICLESAVASYQGKHKCAHGLCKVPVLVCDRKVCQDRAKSHPQSLQCELCRKGYKAPQLVPDLVGLKRQAEAEWDVTSAGMKKKVKQTADTEKDKAKTSIIRDRIFVSRLPLTVTKTKLQEVLGCSRLPNVQWLADKSTGAFYGSCIVQLPSAGDAQDIVARGTMKVDNKSIRVSYCKSNGQQVWPPEKDPNLNREYPPIGKC